MLFNNIIAATVSFRKGEQLASMTVSFLSREPLLPVLHAQKTTLVREAFTRQEQAADGLNITAERPHGPAPTVFFCFTHRIGDP